MSRTKVDITDKSLIKEKVLNWVRKFSTFCLLDSQSLAGNSDFEFLAAAGIKSPINSLKKVTPGKWLFGHVSYDFKNELFSLKTNIETRIGFPLFYFFEPEIIIVCRQGTLEIIGDDSKAIYQDIESAIPNPVHSEPVSEINSCITREEYLGIIRKLKEHIHRGDCYEVNFCIEFFNKAVRIDPLFIYKKLSKVSPNPFSVLYRVDNSWLICASPERFLKRTNNRIISQPIKGTAARYPDDPAKDTRAAEDLSRSEKDKAENVMVVDLVRNDLSIVCRPGSVKVEELFGIYSFPQVYQMISTISGELNDATTFYEIIRACFPMGSMTGAPKKRVMELIEQYEPSPRGIFSGTVGYIDEQGNFDFNVIIRSLMYNAQTGYLSFRAGSGITFYSDPEKEWEECLLKAEAIRNVLMS